MDSESSRRGPENDPLYEQIRNLPEKSQTTIRFFDRDNTVTVYNEDAELLAKRFFRSDGVLKKWGSTVIFINLSVINFENVLREALLSWRYRAELYVKENGCWILSKKASPGNLAHFEDDVFAADSDVSTSQSDEISTCFVSIRVSASETSNVTVGLAFVDVLLREISVIEFQDTPNLYQMETILFRKGPREAIIKKGSVDKPMSAILERAMVLVSEVQEKVFDSSSLVQDLSSILLCKKNQTLNVAALSELTMRHASKALAGAIKYLDLVSQHDQGQFTLKTLQEVNYVKLDPSAIKALHLLPDPMEGVTKEKCLSGILNKCRTGPGQRLLGQYLRQPLTDVRLIDERLDCVTLLVNNPDIRGHLHDNLLRRVPDIQRLTIRFQKQKATLKDVYKIFCGVELLPSLIKSLESNEDAKNNLAFTQKFTQPIIDLSGDLNKFVAMVRTVMDFSKVDSGEYLINPNFSSNLEEGHREIKVIKSKIDSALNSVARKIGREAEKEVKLELHPIHGYCFKVPTRDDKLVRESKDLTWLDNKKDGIRFTNNKMQELSEEYSCKMQEYNEQQKEIVAKVLDITLGYLDPFYRFNDVTAELDVMTSFAVFVATSKDVFVRPEILPAGREIKLTGVRHPCVEKEEKVYYIPNDISLVRNEQELILITGPNMGGKSTFIRSVGIVCLMAQVGCFVPCTSAQVSVVDAIMARIGAGDAIEKGVSSFMAEMLETNVILNTATENSLVIIDELGRGTSTFDGFGLAWAICEHLVTQTKCFSLFATHFHELTELQQKFDKVKNYHFTAKVDQDQLVMMYKMQPGACDQSFGLQVARMVGFPGDVMTDAENKLEAMGSSMFTWEDDKIIAEVLSELDLFSSELSDADRKCAILSLMESAKREYPESNVAMYLEKIIKV